MDGGPVPGPIRARDEGIGKEQVEIMKQKSKTTYKQLRRTAKNIKQNVEDHMSEHKRKELAQTQNPKEQLLKQLQKSASALQTRKNMLEEGIEIFRLIIQTFPPKLHRSLHLPEDQVIKMKAVEFAEMNLKFAFLFGERESLVPLIELYEEETLFTQIQVQNTIELLKTIGVETENYLCSTKTQPTTQDIKIKHIAQECIPILEANATSIDENTVITAPMKLQAVQNFNAVVPPEYRFKILLSDKNIPTHINSQGFPAENVVWHNISGAGKMTEIRTAHGVYGHMTEQKMPGPIHLLVNGVRVLVSGFRMVSLPPSIIPGEIVNLQLALSNLDGSRMHVNGALYLKVTYSDDGQMASLSLPSPPTILPYTNYPAIITHFGKIYTLPVSGWHYRQLVDKIQENGGTIDLGHTQMQGPIVGVIDVQQMPTEQQGNRPMSTPNQLVRPKHSEKSGCSVM